MFDLTPRKILGLAAAAALVAAVLLLRVPAAKAVVEVAEWVDTLGWVAPVVFIGAFTLALPALVPATPFLVSGGILFGPVLGTVYGVAGNIAGGALAFALARHLARRRVEAALESNVGLEVMNRALDREGARAVALIRLSPALPAWLINYGLGVSRIGWKRYLYSAPTILPGTVLYVLAGVGLGDLATLANGGGLDSGPGYYAFLGVGIAATVAVSVLLGRRARKILEELDDESD